MTAALHGGDGLGVNLPCTQQIHGAAREKLNRAVDQWDGDRFRRVGPGTPVGVAHASDAACALTLTGVDHQAVTHLSAIPVQIDEQVQILLHGGALHGRALVVGSPLDRALEVQQCARIKLRKTRESFCFHPAHQLAQILEVTRNRPRALRQSRAQATGTDQRQQHPRSLE
jgi:hypothetical protein